MTQLSQFFGSTKRLTHQEIKDAHFGCRFDTVSKQAWAELSVLSSSRAHAHDSHALHMMYHKPSGWATMSLFNSGLIFYLSQRMSFQSFQNPSVMPQSGLLNYRCRNLPRLNGICPWKLIGALQLSIFCLELLQRLYDRDEGNFWSACQKEATNFQRTLKRSTICKISLY